MAAGRKLRLSAGCTVSGTCNAHESLHLAMKPGTRQAVMIFRIPSHGKSRTLTLTDDLAAIPAVLAESKSSP